MDTDQGPEPFELTKQFMDRAPGAFPAFNLLTAFGQAAPANRDLQRAGRVLPVPFHFLDNLHAMNVRPKHYGWPDFYDQVVDLSRHAYSWPMIATRLRLNRGWIPKWFNVVRAVSSGFGQIKHHTAIRRVLDGSIGPPVSGGRHGRAAHVLCQQDSEQAGSVMGPAAGRGAHARSSGLPARRPGTRPDRGGTTRGGGTSDRAQWRGLHGPSDMSADRTKQRDTLALRLP